MHLLIAILIVYIVWSKRAWTEWKKYHTTILFFGYMELIYNLIIQSSNYFLWKLIPDLSFNRVELIALYVIVIFPGSIMLFFSKYPEGAKKRMLYVSKWVTAYTVIEWIAYLLNKIIYMNGWSIWHSLIFNYIMFAGLVLHHKKPIMAYIAFLMATVLGIVIFHIPIWQGK